MADLPIPFTGPMVRAILREIEQPGTGKTQTRRVINPQPFADGYYEGEIDCTSVPAQASNLSAFFRFGATAVGGGAVRTETWEPRYQPGDRLYVREHWRVSRKHDATAPRDLKPRSMTVMLEAGGSISNQNWRGDWRPSDWRSEPQGEIPNWMGRFRQGMHMPKWASRITLIVTDVRVQRLQDITWGDAKAEGVTGGYHQSEFAALWDSLNDKPNRPGCAWRDNPWVAAYSFRPVLGNIDAVRSDTREGSA